MQQNHQNEDLKWEVKC